MNDKALLTMGLGQHAEYLDVTRPSLRAYAARHGYRYLELDEAVAGRPANWSKIPAMLAALGAYDTVLWVDCDVVALDSSRDVAWHVPDEAMQALAAHTHHQHRAMGEVPNTGVWLVRRSMERALRQLWGMTEYTYHPWTDNAALLDLLGYSASGPTLFPVRRTRETDLYSMTYFLPHGWHSIDYHDEAAHATFMHVPGVEPHEKRLAYLHEWAAKAEQVTAWL